MEIVALEQEKYKLLAEVPKLIEFFFKDALYDDEAVNKTLKNPNAKTILSGIKQTYADIGDFNDAVIEAKTREFAKSNGFKNGQVFHPVRVAVSRLFHAGRFTAGIRSSGN